MKQKALVVFDMDGVLVDVSGSYRDTVRRTARLFFKGARGWESLPEPLFPLSDLARVKQRGGLNNDWDLTAAVLSMLCFLVEDLSPFSAPDPWPEYRLRISRADVTALARFLKNTPFPLGRLMEKTTGALHDFVAACTPGDVGSGNIVKQIFQEIYLGPGLFKTTYGLSPLVYRGEGLIDRERLLIDPKTLEPLFRRHILAIATGRPKLEADYALHRFGVRRFFSAVYTLDDCLEAEKRRLNNGEERVLLSKPHPFMLDALEAAAGKDASRFYYLGDMPDDMIAAARASAPFAGIGVTVASSDKAGLAEALRNAGAAAVIDDFRRLPALLDA